MGDSAIPHAVRAYVGVQFAALCAFALYVFWTREHHSTLLLVVASFLVLFGLGTLGGLLDGRRGASRDEAARVLVCVAFVIGLLLR